MQIEAFDWLLENFDLSESVLKLRQGHRIQAGTIYEYAAYNRKQIGVRNCHFFVLSLFVFVKMWCAISPIQNGISCTSFTVLTTDCLSILIGPRYHR